MSQSQLNKVIDEFNQLSLNDKEYITDILRKQLIEAKREAIYKIAKGTIKNYEEGNVKSGKINDFRRDLEND